MADFRTSIIVQQPIVLNGLEGSVEQVMHSRGTGLSPIWRNRGMRFFYQDTAPAAIDCLPGDKWVKTDDPTLPEYTYIDDGTSLQWVNLSASWVYSGPTSYQVALNFGVLPVDSRVFNITTIPAAVTSNVIVSPSAIDDDELELDMISCAAFVTATDSIRVYANSFPGPVAGTRNFILLVS